MDRTLAVQLQIRQNAEEISSALKDIGGWEKAIKDKDRKLKQKIKRKPNTVETNSTTESRSVPVVSTRTGRGTVPLKSTPSTETNASSTQILTPANLVDTYLKNIEPPHLPVPKALGNYTKIDLEAVERDKGNKEFQSGNFAAAMKSYTKCLGLKAKNYVAFSNRAMAYLKLKEYSRAISDCNAALSIDDQHVKSLLRRAIAFHATGKYRAALRDLLSALTIEPTNKQARQEIQQVRESLRNATQRAPLIPVTLILREQVGIVAAMEVEGKAEQEALELPLQGPDLPIPVRKDDHDMKNNTVDKNIDDDLELF